MCLNQVDHVFKPRLLLLGVEVTFDLPILTFDLPMLTFDLPMLTFDLPHAPFCRNK